MENVSEIIGEPHYVEIAPPGFKEDIGRYWWFYYRNNIFRMLHVINIYHDDPDRNYCVCFDENRRVVGFWDTIYLKNR